MSSMVDSSAAANPLIPLVVTAISFGPPAATAIYTWWKDANRPARRMRVLDEGKKRLDCLDAFLKIQLSVLSADQLEQAKRDIAGEVEKLQLWLRQKLEKLGEKNRDLSAEEQAVSELSRLKAHKRFLLLYPDKTKVLHRFNVSFEFWRFQYWYALFSVVVALCIMVSRSVVSPSFIPGPSASECVCFSRG
jgi:hypothetical protein